MAPPPGDRRRNGDTGTNPMDHVAELDDGDVTASEPDARSGTDAVAIRRLLTDDWPDVLAIYGEGIATGNATFETEVPSSADLDRLWLPGHRWVATRGAAVVGWAAAKPYSPRRAYAGVAETSVFVAGAARGSGVGRALLLRQTSAADSGGLWTLQASIFPENLGSLRLHHGAGFRTVGVRERIGRHHGRWRDVVLLERRC